ncbi:nitroreductase family protein [Methylobacterium isbiliense]|uniref:Malonic semialdehyde reductase RutE n=1 Tax=Methylobacterium isbiliense TaxID=315478 RepID=A0ABQ4SFH8_9HYPH|nr:nitroreductase family protein [Methylobacterium isbiliense]MDN3627836.1 nitroreductase family protein [Methylobacterium isbiliense]GJE01977.1 malonic semialdehyde reductase RutE [Methylobacterium isbiliense]
MTSGPSRTADYPIDPLFLERWSPRAFTGEPISEADLFTMIEAARWAPSSYNSQPWRFIWARRDTPHWDALFGLLVPGNQKWVKDTAALLFLVSNGMMNTKDGLQPSWSASFDTGTASALFQLQAIRMGWHAHGMTGFDKERAPGVLNLPPHHRVEAAFAVGRRADPATLTEEQRARETPNGRRPITDFSHEGGFPPREA